MRTKREIVIENWRNHGRVVIPQGQPVRPCDHGECFVENFGNIFDERTQVMQYHDATHYGIRVKAEDCELASEHGVPRGRVFEDIP